jgi:hypothetical protein
MKKEESSDVKKKKGQYLYQSHYNLGSLFASKGSRRVYLLAHMDGTRCGLLCLSRAPNRARNPIAVKNTNKISKEEVMLMTGFDLKYVGQMPEILVPVGMGWE